MIRLTILLGYLLLVNVSISAQNAQVSAERKLYRYDGYMSLDGYTRHYIVNLPPHYYDSKKHSLIIALHGGGGSALQCEHDYKLTQKANEENCVIVYPEGVKNDGPLRLRTWNAGTCCNYAAEHQVNDVKFISDLIDTLTTTLQIDAKRVYVTGMSNGGMLAYRLAVSIPEKIAAIAPVSSTMVVSLESRPYLPVPILHIHSESDKTVPAKGGIGIAGYSFPAVDSILHAWVSINHCTSPEPITTIFEKYTKYEWRDQSGKSMIEYYLTKDGGHAWPGGFKARIKADTPSTAIDANELIWAFFKRHPKP